MDESHFLTPLAWVCSEAAFICVQTSCMACPRASQLTKKKKKQVQEHLHSIWADAYLMMTNFVSQTWKFSISLSLYMGWCHCRVIWACSMIGNETKMSLNFPVLLRKGSHLQTYILILTADKMQTHQQSELQLKLHCCRMKVVVYNGGKIFITALIRS